MGSFQITSVHLTFSVPLIVVFRYHKSAQGLSRLHQLQMQQVNNVQVLLDGRRL